MGGGGGGGGGVGKITFRTVDQLKEVYWVRSQLLKIRVWYQLKAPCRQHLLSFCRFKTPLKFLKRD